ncbi:hypothetical protein PpBr36_03154 [Pyricularia pennisetigena]|uniref:hypothetical protein n=1 Tax=Pyricularia pennisetigena TaxID=1578925 RepID=UPI00114EB830|nr:hypothetical protein PpBr36_03154 [Pyricularia pennisetigena]TLS29899.1 hypothetical protein PpBr36_03154 [Pyricularia pennisetigena]
MEKSGEKAAHDSLGLPNNLRAPAPANAEYDMSTPEGSVNEKSHRSSKEWADEPSESRQVDGEEVGEGSDAEPQTSATAPRAASRASSARSRALSVVPTSRRRGLFSRFAVFVPEVYRPFDYSAKTKWTITFIVALAGSAAPMGSGILYPVLSDVAVDLKTSPTIANLTVAVYALAMAIFPIWWSSFSETFGRRTVYIVSFGLGIVFSILSAVSTNIAMLIVMRVLGGGASASVQAVGAGTISDIWEVRERGKAMGMFYLGPLMGPLLAPIVGGALAQKWNWRSTMWFVTIHAGLVFLMLLFCLPETLRRKESEQLPRTVDDDTTGDQPQLARATTRQSIAKSTKNSVKSFKRYVIDPLKVLGTLRFLPIAVTVFIAAITFGSLFMLNISTQSSYSKAPYAFSTLIVGLLYIPSSLGYVVSSIFGGRWIDHIMAREARKAERYDADGRLVYLPEDRMCENAWLAASVYPSALIMFGWTIDKGLHWAVPSVASLLFGLSSMLIFSAATTMLTEFMPSKSSSGIAVNNFVRNIFSCVGTVITQPLIDAMGVGWLCTLVGLLALVLSLGSVYSLKRFGPKWRKEMDRKLAI